MKKHLYTISVLFIFSVFFWLLPNYISQSDLLQKWVLETRDVFFKIRHFSSQLPDRSKEIIIVSIDEESCEKLGLRWPWPRKTFAAMIDHLSEHGARVVGLNVSFTGLEEGDAASSRELARAMRDHGNVVIGATFDKQGRLVKPSPVIAEAASRYGYLEKIVDADFSIRKSYLLRPYSGQGFESSFPLQILAGYSGASISNNAAFDNDLGLVTVGTPHLGIYVSDDGSYTINYLADESDFVKIPAWKVVNGQLPAGFFRNKVVLVGLTSSLFSDTHPTPFGILSGIEIHANEVLSALLGRMLRFVPDTIAYLVSWLAALCILALFLFRRFWFGVIGAIVAFAGLFLGAQIIFGRDFIMEPFILLLGPFLATLGGIAANSLKLLLENRGLENKVIHDKMTGLYKYDYLRECLDQEWKRCKRAGLPVAIAMTDLDRFKRINDTLGHEVGNDMIKNAGAVIKESARRYDIVSRYGGDEFTVLLWHSTLEDAKAYRQRLRDMYHEMAKKLDNDLLKESSISIGIAAFNPAVDPNYPPDPQRLIEDADKDLFMDKESRRKPGEKSR